MSDVLLLLGLATAFVAIALGTLAVGISGVERKRALHVLEAQVGQATTANLREQDLSRGFGSRVVVPIFTGLSHLAHKITPQDARDRIRHKLALAGEPASWDVDKVIGAKMFGIAGGLILGIFMTNVLGVADGIRLLLIVIATGVGFYLPNAAVGHMADARQLEIRRTLPDTMDLLTISVEAGLGFNAALVQVIQNVPGALSQEFARVLQEMRLGKPRKDAFRSLTDRTNVEELKSFVVALVQAEQFGVSISGVLRAQAIELRKKRRQRAEEAAAKIPTKILFPLIFCVLPGLFVVVLGPGVIKIIQSITGSM